jgi:hypothetical protein
LVVTINAVVIDGSDFRVAQEMPRVPSVSIDLIVSEAKWITNPSDIQGTSLFERERVFVAA